MTTAGTIYAALQNQAGGNGLLTYVSATQIKFIPYGGNFIRIAGQWYGIPSAGIAAANTSVFVNGAAGQNLAANTLYFVYLFSNASALTLDFSTVGHSTSVAAGNAGTEIKTGNGTRSLIGAVYTDASSQFVNSALRRLVRSWFNRQAERLTMTATRATQFKTTSATFVSMAMVVDFVAWQDEMATAHLISSAFNSPGFTWETIFWWDGAPTSVHHTTRIGDGGGNWMSNNCCEHKMLNEGRHTLDPATRAPAGGAAGATIGGGGPGVLPSLSARLN